MDKKKEEKRGRERKKNQEFRLFQCTWVVELEIVVVVLFGPFEWEFESKLKSRRPSISYSCLITVWMSQFNSLFCEYKLGSSKSVGNESESFDKIL